MNIDERNTWLVDNIEHVTQLLTNFCNKYEEVDFEELYLEIIERLISFLDTHEHVRYGYFLSDTSKHINIWQWIQNQSMKFKKSKKVIEEPHYCFEELYFRDLDLNFITDYVYEIAKEVLNPWELATFLMRVEWECSFKDIAEILEFNSPGIARNFYRRACLKLHATVDLRNKLKDFRELYFIGGY